MIISPFTKNPAERDDSHDLLTLNLAELFEQFPIRLRSEPADVSSMVKAMEGVIMSKHVENWADNSNMLGRIGSIYSTLSSDAAEIVDGMSAGSLDELGLGTFSPVRNDEYLARITEQETAPIEAGQQLGETDAQALMAREARMIINNSFSSTGLTDENFTLAS